MKYTDLNKNNEEHYVVLDRELKAAARALYTQWFSIFNSLYILSKHLVANYKVISRDGKRERILQQIVGSRTVDPELGASNHEDIGTLHRTIARTKRHGGFYRNMLEFNQQKVENELYYSKADFIPIIFEETFVRADGLENISMVSTQGGDMEATSIGEADSIAGKISNSKIMKPMIKETQQIKYVFLSHGFQGTHYDCLKIKYYMNLQRPDVVFHCIIANEEQTATDIEDLGLNLANEVRRVLKNQTSDTIGSISFIGHSQGGLIIRAALPHLEEYKNHFKTLLTFSSPHLGVSAGDSKLVETGFNILTSWKKFTALKQMGLKDAENPRDCFLYKLSKKQGLGWFKEVILISSPQDTYSPYDSSRIQTSKTNSSDEKTSMIFIEMVENLMNKLKSNKIRRVDVCMKFPKTTMDTFIGRAAHIALISDGILLETLSYRYADLL
jgi:hypothetical protein